MPKKISITFLFTMLLAIFVLFGYNRVLGQSRIEQPVQSTQVLFKFFDPDGKEHEARITRNISDANDWKVFVDGEEQKKKRELNEFSFCKKLSAGTGTGTGTRPKVTIGGEQYYCHVLQMASDGAFLIGNHSCPLFLNPPGIWIDLCPGSHL